MADFHKGRQRFIQLFFILAIAILLLKALEIQLLDTSYQDRARTTAIDKEILYPSRGLILDRHVVEKPAHGRRTGGKIQKSAPVGGRIPAQQMPQRPSHQRLEQPGLLEVDARDDESPGDAPHGRSRAPDGSGPPDRRADELHR